MNDNDYIKNSPPPPLSGIHFIYLIYLSSLMVQWYTGTLAGLVCEQRGVSDGAHVGVNDCLFLNVPFE